MNEIDNILERIRENDIDFAEKKQAYLKLKANLKRQLGEAYIREMGV